MGKNLKKAVGIILNGVTGRMGSNHHLVRSILAIRNQGGLKTENEIIIPDPVLVGRNEEKLRKLASKHGLKKYSTDLDTCLSDPYNEIYFDAGKTGMRAELIKKAIIAGKSIYCEKPLASSLKDAISLCREVDSANLKNGIVQDKLWLPGILKLRGLIKNGFFGKIISARGEFGYWIFDGYKKPCQRPSWNYRLEEGGGIISDMFSHWSYLLENLFGTVKSVSCYAAINIKKRLDEDGKGYNCTAEDAAYATFICGDDVVCQFNSSWSVRVRRDDLLTIQVDGTEGSAVAGLQKCYIQEAKNTKKYVWNPDSEIKTDYKKDWHKYKAGLKYENPFKAEWELFLKHHVTNSAFQCNFIEGAKGCQLAEMAHLSWKERKWVDVQELKI
jgi:predicted dehydrogenase